MDSVKQIIFVAHDRNGIVMLRITRVHKIHEEAHLVDIVPRLDCPMPMFQVSRAELEEQDTFFAIWCQCQGQGISHIASHLAGTCRHTISSVQVWLWYLSCSLDE